MAITQGDTTQIEALVNSQHLKYEFDVAFDEDVSYDISCFILDATNKLVDTKYFVFYNQKVSPCKSLSLMRKEDDSFFFKLNHSTLPSYATKLVFVLTCDKDSDLAHIESVKARFVDEGRTIEAGGYDASEKNPAASSILLSVIDIAHGFDHQVIGLGQNKALSDLLDGFTHASSGLDSILSIARHDTEKTERQNASEAKTASELTQKPSTLTEHELYGKLIDFVRNNLGIYGIRIDEKTSSNKKGKGGNQWLHPDVVALETVDQEWDTLIRNCVRLSGGQSARLWSFEVKKELTGGNARMSFFQAVSNSSWANEGYLVTCSIHHSVEAELKMLSALHGIGVILLDPNNPDSSSIWLPAQRRERVDWQTANRIANTNKDYKRYIDLVSTYYETGRLRESDWGNL